MATETTQPTERDGLRKQFARRIDSGDYDNDEPNGFIRLGNEVDAAIQAGILTKEDKDEIFLHRVYHLAPTARPHDWEFP